MKKTMDEFQKCISSGQVNDAFNTSNRSSSVSVYDLSINLLVSIYWERKSSQSGEWKKSFNILSVWSKWVIIELLHGTTRFRGTSIKTYFIDN